MIGGSTEEKPGSEGAEGAPGRWTQVAFALFVAFQVAVPLSYYLRADPYDERFAWRMFSDLRVHHCEAVATEVRDGQATTVVLGRVIHYAWIEHLERNRRAVIERYLRTRCIVPGVTRATVVNACEDAAQEPLPEQRYALDCATGRLSWPSARIDSGGEP